MSTNNSVENHSRTSSFRHPLDPRCHSLIQGTQRMTSCSIIRVAVVFFGRVAGGRRRGLQPDWKLLYCRGGCSRYIGGSPERPLSHIGLRFEVRRRQCGAAGLSCCKHGGSTKPTPERSGQSIRTAPPLRMCRNSSGTRNRLVHSRCRERRLSIDRDDLVAGRRLRAVTGRPSRGLNFKTAGICRAFTDGNKAPAAQSTFGKRERPTWLENTSTHRFGPRTISSTSFPQQNQPCTNKCR